MKLRANPTPSLDVRGSDMSPLANRKIKRRKASPLRHRHNAAFVERLEERRLLAVTGAWDSVTSKLTVTGTNAADEIYVRAVGGYVNVENASGSVVHWSGSGSSVTPSMVQRIDIVGTDSLAAADGADKINLAAVTAGNGFTSIVGTTLNGGAGDDTITGSPFADVIIGHKGSDSILCGDGNDTVTGTISGNTDGGEGTDRIYGEGGNDSITGGIDVDSIVGGDGDDILSGGDGSEGNELEGSAGNDTITGADGSEGDTITGGAGNDSLIGGGGTPGDIYIFSGTALGDDTITENETTYANKLDFSGFTGGGVTIDIGSTVQHQPIGGSTSITLSNGSAFAIVIGSGANDSITGNSRANHLEGGDGADLLSGLAADDTLIGAAGNDTLVGGGGNDRFVFSGSDLGSDSITEVNDLDADTLDFAQFGGPVVINFGSTASMQPIGGSTSITLSHGRGIEHAIGSNYPDVLTGNDRNNSIQGGGGGDTLTGGDGHDTLVGSDGNDSLTAGTGDDQLFGGDGDDTLIASIGIDSLFAGAGNDLFRADLIAGSANISTDVSPGNDSLTINLPAGTANNAVSIDHDSVNHSNWNVTYSDVVLLLLQAADGNNTINVYQPDVGSLPSQVLIVTNGGSDSVTLILSSSPLATEFAIHGGLGSNDLEVRGTAFADFFDLSGNTLDVATGVRVLVSDVSQLILDLQGGNDQVILRNTTLGATVTVRGGNDADRIELNSPVLGSAGNFVLNGEAGDDTIAVRNPLTTGTTVNGGTHVSGDLLDLSHNNLSAATLPVQFTGVETVDLSYNAFVNAPALATGVVTADLRYNNLSQLGNLAASTTLRHLLLHGNSNSPDFASLRGRLYKTDLPAIGLEKAERLPNAQDALMAVARALHFSPLEIYEYVLNNYEFQAYAGLMKGVRGTLLTHAGNAWDLSELLIGLLNAAGTSLDNLGYRVERLLLPFDEARAWLGVETNQAARDVLLTSGLVVPAQFQKALGFEVTHTWVSANFAAVGGPSAIALDPSWKFRDYRAGIRDLVRNVPFFQNNSTLESTYLSAVRSALPSEWYEDRLAEYLREHFPGKTLADVSRGGPIRAQTFSTLPHFLSGLTSSEYLGTHSAGGPLEYTHQVQLVFSGPFAPQSVTYQVRNVAFTPLFVTWSTTTEVIMGTTVTIHQPILHRGSDTLGLTPFLDNPNQQSPQQLHVQVTLIEPDNGSMDGGSHSATYRRNVGTVMAIGLDANQSNDVLLSEQQALLNQLVESRSMSAFGQDGIGNLLALAVWTHFRRADESNNMLDAYAHIVRGRNVVEAGMVSSQTTLTLRGNYQNPYVPSGLYVDMKDIVVHWPHDIYAVDTNPIMDVLERDQFRLQQLTRSALEHAVLEEVFNAESISTIRALQIANDPILDPNNDNVVRKLNLATPGLSSILNQLSNDYGALGPSKVGTINDTFESGTIWGYIKGGATVHTHSQLIAIGESGDWTGIGYFVEKVDSIGFYYRFAIADIQGNAADGGGASRKAHTYFTPPQTVSSQTVGDPVNISNGSVYEDVVDIEIPRPGLPLNFARHYESSSNLDRGLGEGWTHTYSHFLSFNPAGEPSGSVAWTDEQGIRTVFKPNGSGGYIVPTTRRGEFRRIPANVGIPEHYIWRDKTGRTLEFTSSGRLMKMSDRNGNAITLQYDPALYGGPVRLKAAIHSATNNGLTFEYNLGDDRFDRIRDMASRVWQYNLNDGLLREVISPSSANTLDARFQYNYYATTALDPTHHKLKEVIQPDGGKITYHYYPNGRAFQVVDPEDYVQTLQYNQHKNEARFIDERLNTTIYVYNSIGAAVKEVRPDRSTIYTSWNDGLVRERIGDYGISELYDYTGAENERLGNITAIRRRLRYDGTLNAIKDPLDPQRNMQVDELFSHASLHEGGNPSNPFLVSVMTSSTDRVGTITNYGYDVRGNVTGITQAVDQPEQYSTGMTYFANGLLQTITQPRGTATGGVADDFKTTYAYDPSGSGKVASTTTWIATGVSAVETFQYDSSGMGHMNERFDANNHRTFYTNDLLGRVIAETRPEQFPGQSVDDRTWRTLYFRSGQVERTIAPGGRTAIYSYDRRQLLLSTLVVDPSVVVPTDRVVTVMGHDALRNIVFQADGNGNLTRFDYDARNRRTRTILADGTSQSTVFNDAGQMLLAIDALGRRTKLEYDTLGRMFKQTEPDPDGGGVLTSPEWNYRYDDLGNVTAVIDPRNVRTDTTYDRLSRVTSVLYADPDDGGPLLRRRITNEYYADGDLRAISEVVPGTSHTVRRTEFDVDGLHRRTAERFKEGGPQGTQLYSTVTAYDAVGNMTVFSDRLGHATTYEYNDQNQLIKMTQPAPFGGGPETKPVWQYTYDRHGNRFLEIDPLGHKTRTTHDGLNRPIRSERLDGAGDVVRSRSDYAYDAAGNMVAMIDPLGRQTFGEFDRRNRPIESLDAMLTSTKTQYDAVGNVVLTLISAGSSQLERPTLYEYDNLNRLIRRVDSDPDGNGPAYVSPQWRFEYDKAGNVTKVTDPRLSATHYTYDRLNRQTQEQDALNQISKTSYDNFGNVAKTDDRRGRSFSYEYDALNHVTHTRQLRFPGGGGVQELVGHVATTYDANGNLRDEYADVFDLTVFPAILRATRHTTYGYDALDRSTSVTDNDGQSWITIYDKSGNVAFETDPLNRRTEYSYDALNRSVARRIMDGANVFSTSTTIYDAAGNVTAETDPVAQTSTFGYDRLDRAVLATDARGFSTISQFDPYGNHTAVIDAAGNTTRWTYDALNRLRAEQQFTSAGALVGGTVGYAYDANGNLTHKTDRRNNTTLFQYNALNRLELEEWRVGGTFAGTPVHSIAYTYEVDGRLTRVEDSGNGLGEETLYELNYDSAGRLNTYDYTGPFGLAEITGSLAHFSDGQLQHSNTSYLPAGGPSTVLNMRAEYDNVGRLQSVVHAGNSVDVAPMNISFGYNAAGDLTSIQRFNGATPVGSSSFGYANPAGWLTSILHTGQGTIAGYSLSYRPDGQLSSQTRTATPDAGSFAYAYDETNQLVGVNHSGSSDELYGYDATGNRTSSSAPGQSGSYQTDALNRVVDDGTYTYTYDADGNQLTRTHKSTGEFTQYGWDHRNRLTSVVGYASAGGALLDRVDYVYDYRDRRIARAFDPRDVLIGPQLPVSYTHYLYNDDDQLLLELANGDVTHRYAYGPLVDQVLLDESDVSGGGREMRWLHADHQGTIRDITNNAGTIIDRRTFDSFGRTISDSSAAVDTLFGYTGQEYDAAVDLYNYNARWYDADTGRFLSQDPAKDDTNPYRYVGNNAPNATDPTGLVAQTKSLSGNASKPRYDTYSQYFAPSSSSSQPYRGSQVATTASVSGSFANQRPIETFGSRATSLWEDVSGAFGGYWGNVGATAKGYFINTPINAVTGTVSAALHPIDTATGLWNAAAHPVNTWQGIKTGVSQSFSTYEGQGEFFGNVVTSILPAAKLKDISKLRAVSRLSSAADDVADASRYQRLMRAADVGLDLSDDAARRWDNFVIDTYSNLSHRTDLPGQAHHLNQFAAYRDVIDSLDAVTIKLEGNIFTDARAPHTLAHRSLEGFWDQYRGTRKTPTNLEYTRALQQSLRDAGLPDHQVQQAVRAAVRERVQYGLLGGDEVPRLPNPIPNLAQ